MAVANIKDFRARLDEALAEAGFAPKRLEPKAPRQWVLPGAEVVPSFTPHAYRQWWGFRLGGYTGFDLVALRTWLEPRFTKEGMGVFRHGFVASHIANDPVLGNFSVTLDQDVPFSDWVGLIKQRLEELPDTLDGIVDAYRDAPNRLIGLDMSVNKPAWDFLLDWYARRDTALKPPQSFF